MINFFCHERCTTCKEFRAKFNLNENRLVECNEIYEEISKMKPGDILMGDISKVRWAVVRATNISNNYMDSLIQLFTFKHKLSRS